MSDPGEKILLQQLAQGNKEAFNSLFRKYYVQMCRYAVVFVKSHELAEDATQQVFIRLWNQKNNIDIRSSFVAYLFGAVKNQCINDLRKQSVRSKHEIVYSSGEAVNVTVTDNDNNQEKIRDAIGRATLELPGKCREIFMLSRNDGLSYDEIAHYLNISPKTVENQMGIAFKKLREILKPILNKIYD